MAKLNQCLHCGSAAEFAQNSGGGIFAGCTHCGIQTPAIPASVDYSARDKAAALWNSQQAQEWPEWIQPLGAHDAYSRGSKVSHNEQHWISNVDVNVWEPGISGWTAQ